MRAATEGIPEIEGLFTWPSKYPRLIGSRCDGCSTYFFPAHAVLHRPGCSDSAIREHLFSNVGRLMSYTIQHYPPPPPYPAPDRSAWTPEPIGTVALPEGLQVPGSLLGIQPDQLRLGIEVRIVARVLYVGSDGVNRLSWAFQPTASW